MLCGRIFTERLHARLEAAFAHVFALLRVLPGLRDDLLGLVHGNVFLHDRLFVRRHGAVKEFGLCPERAYRHNMHPLLFQLAVERTAVVQNKSLCRAVNVDIRDGLKRRNRRNIDDLAAGRHIRHRELAERHDRLAVEIDHIEIDLERRIHHGAEFAEAAGVDEKSDLRLLLAQEGGIRLIRRRVGKIE